MSTPNRPVNRVTSKRRPAKAAGESAAGEAVTGEAAPGESAVSETVAGKPVASEAGAATPAASKAGAAAPVASKAGSAASEARSAGSGTSLDKAADKVASAGAGAAGDEPASAAPEAGPAEKRGLRGWAVPAACVLAAAVLAGFAAIAALRPGVPDGDEAFVDTGATEEVRAAADNALKTIYGYDATAIDGYPDAVRQVVTGDMLKDLDQFAPTTIDAIKQSQTSATAAADPIGVTLLTDDHAELLVNLVVSATKDGAAQQSVAGPVVLRMTKVDGRWLAAEIVDR
ncbi:hypothetical protein AB0H71_11850 [Nocardia sp. NPDC050697]|uniref:hypothetical protein n=1 Tax=Nocardia sp. NPDC050697 TaxID=3155158 RepID=UPI0033ED8F8E